MKPLVRSTLLFLALATLSACSILEEEPTGKADAFLLMRARPTECQPDRPPCYWKREAALTRISSEKQAGISEPITNLVIDDSAQVLKIWNVPQDQIPLKPGHRYVFEGDAYSGMTFRFEILRIMDEQGLLYYGATSPSFSEDRVLKLAPEGWSITWTEANLRPYDAACGTRATPQLVKVSDGNGTVWLRQGDSKKLGNYIIECRVAVVVEYVKNTCLDFAAPEISLIIRKVQVEP